MSTNDRDPITDFTLTAVTALIILLPTVLVAGTILGLWYRLFWLGWVLR